MSGKSFMLMAHESVSLDADETHLLDAYNAQISTRASSPKDIGQATIYRGTLGFLIGDSDQQFFALITLIETMARRHGISMDVIKATPMAIGEKRQAGALILPASRFRGLNA